MSPCHLVAVLYAFIHENSYQSTYLLIKSIHYEKESIFFDDDVTPCSILARSDVRAEPCF